MMIDLNNSEKENLNNLLKDIKEKWAISLLKKINKSKIKTFSVKAKGREFQKQIALDISAKFDLIFEKDTGDIEVRQMGQAGVDVILRNEGLKKIPFSIECKNTKRFSTSFITQARNNQKEGTNWLLVWKGYKEKPIAMLEWDVFLDILSKRKE